jgi:hypothetical protein
LRFHIESEEKLYIARGASRRAIDAATKSRRALRSSSAALLLLQLLLATGQRHRASYQAVQQCTALITR